MTKYETLQYAYVTRIVDSSEKKLKRAMGDLNLFHPLSPI